MTRVAIIGSAGGGNTQRVPAFSRQFGRARDLPVYPVDQLRWRYGCPLLPMTWPLRKMI